VDIPIKLIWMTDMTRAIIGTAVRHLGHGLIGRVTIILEEVGEVEVMVQNLCPFLLLCLFANYTGG